MSNKKTECSNQSDSKNPLYNGHQPSSLRNNQKVPPNQSKTNSGYLLPSYSKLTNPIYSNNDLNGMKGKKIAKSNQRKTFIPLLNVHQPTGSFANNSQFDSEQPENNNSSFPLPLFSKVVNPNKPNNHFTSSDDFHKVCQNQLNEQMFRKPIENNSQTNQFNANVSNTHNNYTINPLIQPDNFVYELIMNNDAKNKVDKEGKEEETKVTKLNKKQIRERERREKISEAINKIVNTLGIRMNIQFLRDKNYVLNLINEVAMKKVAKIAKLKNQKFNHRRTIHLMNQKNEYLVKENRRLLTNSSSPVVINLNTSNTPAPFYFAPGASSGSLAPQYHIDNIHNNKIENNINKIDNRQQIDNRINNIDNRINNIDNHINNGTILNKNLIRKSQNDNGIVQQNTKEKSSQISRKETENSIQNKKFVNDFNKMKLNGQLQNVDLSKENTFECLPKLAEKLKTSVEELKPEISKVVSYAKEQRTQKRSEESSSSSNQ